VPTAEAASGVAPAPPSGPSRGLSHIIHLESASSDEDEDGDETLPELADSDNSDDALIEVSSGDSVEDDEAELDSSHNGLPTRPVTAAHAQLASVQADIAASASVHAEMDQIESAQAATAPASAGASARGWTGAAMSNVSGVELRLAPGAVVAAAAQQPQSQRGSSGLAPPLQVPAVHTPPWRESMPPTSPYTRADVDDGA